MKNENLTNDLTWLRSANDTTMTTVVGNIQDYVEQLEAKEDRLHKLENVLNDIDNSDMVNKDVFLEKFKELQQ